MPGGSNRGQEQEASQDAQADRRYTELLQELRVAQTGVQFLFAFLLTLAFTQRFAHITDLQKWLYLGTLVVSAVAAALLIGPVPMHRILHGSGLKPRLVRASHVMVGAGLVALVVAINGAILLVVDVVLGGWLPFLVAGLTTLWFVFVWYVVPVTTRERNE
jgi:hypothetical protein